MLKRSGLGKVLLTGLLMGCEFPVAPGRGNFICDGPAKIDTITVLIKNEEEWKRLCNIKYRGERDARRVCHMLWTGQHKAQEMNIYRNRSIECPYKIFPEGIPFPPNPYPSR